MHPVTVLEHAVESRPDGRREREALGRRARPTAVRCHHDMGADAHAGVHDLLLEARRPHPRRHRLGRLFEENQKLPLRPDRITIESDGLFAAAVEESARSADSVSHGVLEYGQAVRSADCWHRPHQLHTGMC